MTGFINEDGTFPVETCHECGRPVKANWYVQHLKSGCKRGVHRRPVSQDELKQVIKEITKKS